MANNREMLRKGAITTDTVAAGLLNPEQSKKFIVEAMEQTALGGLIRKEFRKARTGELDKIGVGSRMMRKKTENTDDGTRNSPNFSKVEYSTVAVRLPWEITEETLRENIEGEGLEALITNLMSEAVAIDMEDLWVNADESTPATYTVGSGDDEETLDTPDYDFLKVNDGWLVQLEDGAHVVDRSSVDSGEMSLDVWNAALKAIPNKYNNGKLRWLMSPHRQQEWETYLLDKAITAGGIVSDRRIENPYAIPTVAVPCFPDDKIVLVDPRNLIVVYTYEVKIRKTTEGESAIMQDKRFYVIHLDFDTVIEELDAAVIITGLEAIS